MGNILAQLASQLRELFLEMPASRRLAVMIFLGLVVSALIAVMMWAREPSYQVLYSGLSQTDATSVMDKLRERRIPYRAEAGSILVPADQIHESRLALAQEGLPTGGGVGFEIFDRTSLGVTDFVQKVNFLRALQGELARTISKIQGVDSARVHIVMPDRSLFAEDQRKPSVSVVVDMASGTSLSKSQVKGIVHLVASAVEGVESKNVTVIDNRGNVLAGGEEDSEDGFVTASQMEFETSLERRLESRIESMLAKVVGVGKVVARVDVELNRRRVERTRELFDPDKQVVRSERRVKENNENGQAVAGGVPGVQSNVPDSEQAGAGQSSSARNLQKSSRVSETTNFEIDKTVEHVVEPTGDVRRISAAVMVDGTYTGGGNGQKQQFQPRAKKEIENFASLVSAALGLNPQRGDTVKVVSVPFRESLNAGAAQVAADASRQAFLATMVKSVIAVITIALIFIYVIRPMLSWIATLEFKPQGRRYAMSAGPDGAPLPEGALAGILQAAKQTEPVEKTPQQLQLEQARQMYEEVYDYVDASPEKAADLLRAWMKER